MRAAVHHTPIYPVGDVECPVETECGKIVRRDRFRFASPLEQEQLWENGDGLEIYGKGPHNLHHSETVIEYEGKRETGSKQVLDLERVDGRVVGGAATRHQRVQIGTCA